MDVRSWPAVLLRFVLAVFIAITASIAAVADVATAADAATTFTYDTPAAARGGVGESNAVQATPGVPGVAREESASPTTEGQRAPTTLADSVVATNTAGSLADEAAGLLGGAEDVVVLGRQVDTAVAKGWDGHVVLNSPNWSLELNDAFMQGAIAQGRKIYLATPTTGNLIQTSGRFAGQPTVYARELNMLREAGYIRVGDYMVPG